MRAEAARRGFNQADLRRATGLSKTTAHQRWHGRTAWTVAELQAISELLGMTMLDLGIAANIVTADDLLGVS